MPFTSRRQEDRKVHPDLRRRPSGCVQFKQIANLTCTDELDLYSIGEKKVALFCCIPDADTSLNYLVGMIYSNLFQTLYYVADRKYHGKLPIPVHCIMDEWPNVALPDDFDKLLATMRSRAISCSIIIQTLRR